MKNKSGNKKYWGCVLLFFTLTLFSCGTDNKIGSTLTVTPLVQELVFSANGQLVTAGGERIEPAFTVDAGEWDWDYRMIPENSWCQVERTSTGFKVIAAYNRMQTDQEEVTLHITSGKAEPVTIKLMQKAPVRNVYISGYRRYPDDFFGATYWKNGEPFDLSIGLIGSTAEDIYVADGDVYVVGSETIDSKTVGQTLSVARFWKNGKRDWLGDDVISSVASAIVKDGDDLYIAGTILPTETSVAIPAYWKNGEVFHLPAEGEEATAHSIVILNGDVYVGGNDNYKAVYWKNGERYNVGEMRSYGMAVTDGGVYLVGGHEEGPRHYPILWHNEEFIPLQTSNQGVIYDLEIADGDIYMAGRDFTDRSHRKACYWKNNEQVWLEGGDNSYATGVAIVGTDVYVTGSLRTSTSDYRAVYWVNGELHTLDYFGTTTGICILEE